MSEDTDRLLTGAEVQDRLQIGRTTLYELRAAGLIHAVQTGRHVKYEPAEVARYIREQTVTAPA